MEPSLSLFGNRRAKFSKNFKFLETIADKMQKRSPTSEATRICPTFNHDSRGCGADENKFKDPASDQARSQSRLHSPKFNNSSSLNVVIRFDSVPSRGISGQLVNIFGVSSRLPRRCCAEAGISRAVF